MTPMFVVMMLVLFVALVARGLERNRTDVRKGRLEIVMEGDRGE